MNFEDVRVGQILVDQDGNQFEVMEIDRMDDEIPVCLKLVKHVKAFAVPGNEFEVMEPGQGFADTEFWIERELISAQKSEFNVPCIDVESLRVLGTQGTEADQKPSGRKTSEVGEVANNRSHLQTKAVEEAEELYDIVHHMFVLPKPEEMRQLVKQHQLDDVFQVIRDAARRGEQEVNLPQGDIDGIGGILIAAGYQVYFTGHPQRCYVRW